MPGDSSLRIRSVEIHPLDIPLKTPFKIATMTAQSAPNVLVSVVTESGLVGWGEASFMQTINGESQRTVVAALQDLAEFLVGCEAVAVHSLFRKMDALLPGNTAAKCALETALCDLNARAAGLSMCRWLGGEHRSMATDMTIGAVSPEEAAESAAHWVEQGFRHIKVKIGGELRDDIQRVSAIQKAIGSRDVAVRLDANQGYSRKTAHDAFFGEVFGNIEFCEQPLEKHDLAGMKWLSENAYIPMMADESVFSAKDASTIVQMGACPLINVKTSKSGGVTGAMEIASVAEAGGLTAMMGGMMETRLGVTASAHAASARPVFQYFDLDANKDHTVDFIQGGVQIVDGCVILPDGPGLGASPDPDFLAKWPSIEVE